MALDAGTWLQRVMCICESYGLSKPVGEEQLPVGNGSNPVKFLLIPDNCCFFVLFQIFLQSFNLAHSSFPKSYLQVLNENAGLPSW